MGAPTRPHAPSAPELAGGATGAPMKCLAMDRGGHSDATRTSQGGGGVWGRGPQGSSLPHPGKFLGHHIITCYQEGHNASKPRI